MANTPAAAFSRTRLLMVDDDTRLCELIRDYLDAMGFEVALAHTGTAGLARALGGGFDAILLDVMLPGMDGFEVLQRIRASCRVPVIMLTGRGEETDRIVGLEVGADDYVPKTTSMRELLARIRAVLRRSTAPSSSTGVSLEPPLEVGDLLIDPNAREARIAGHVLALTPAEFELLYSLARSCGRVKSREQLLHDVSARELEIFERSIDVHVSSLRKKLGDDPRNPRFIQTVRSAGYMFRRPEPGALQ